MRRSFIHVVLLAVLSPLTARAQKGSGNACTIDFWGTPFGCEQFSWSASTLPNTSIRLWDVSQGYCIMNSVSLGNSFSASQAQVSVLGGTWYLTGQGSSGNNNENGLNATDFAGAMCFQFPNAGAPIFQSQNGNSNIAGFISTNSNFCGISGLGYQPSFGQKPIYYSAGIYYPTTAVGANLMEVVSNAHGSIAPNDIIFSECLVALNYLWWGQGGIGGSMGQPVVQYHAWVHPWSAFVTDVAAANWMCSLETVTAIQGSLAITADLEVDPQTGNWGIYGSGEVQIACIDPTGAFINAGGPAQTPYFADEDFSGGTNINHTNTIDRSAVTNPAPQAVYQSARTGNFTYTLPGFSPGSVHRVRLHFAETYFSARGRRIFNVVINGQPVLSNFDIYATAGAKNKAIAPTFTEAASPTGQFVIQFTSVVNSSLVSAIEVE